MFLVAPGDGAGRAVALVALAPKLGGPVSGEPRPGALKGGEESRRAAVSEVQGAIKAPVRPAPARKL